MQNNLVLNINEGFFSSFTNLITCIQPVGYIIFRRAAYRTA